MAVHRSVHVRVRRGLRQRARTSKKQRPDDVAPRCEEASPPIEGRWNDVVDEEGARAFEESAQRPDDDAETTLF